MLKNNWHTHTARCGHARGSDEEYVLEAIKAGVKKLGFSDHASYHDPDDGLRMNYDDYTEYKNSVLSLREKYKDQIDIYLGMEVEYYPDQWTDLTKYRNETDYCILGQHKLSYNGKSAFRRLDEPDLKAYTDAIEAACSRGLCDYIAHPDVIMFSYPKTDRTVIETARRIADISVRYQMPVELNCGSGVIYGKRLYQDCERYGYPVRQFFKEFAERNCPVIIGLDIHDPKNFRTDIYINRALGVIEGLGCNIIDDYDLVSAAKERKKSFR